MSKSSRPLSQEQLNNAQLRQIWHEFLDKIWTILVILGLAAIIVYGVVIQILHHP